MKLRRKIEILITGITVLASAQQSTDYIIVEAPIGAQTASKKLWVKWTGASRAAGYPAPDSGRIYYDRSPGGGRIGNYRYTITVPYTDTSIKSKDSICDNIYFSPTLSDPVAKRGIAFRAADQPGMGFGVFYCVVALPLANDTLVSNEFTLIIESPQPVDWIEPSGKITSMTPAFRWNANPGVPYYHIILSDDIIKIDSSSGEVNLQGLSIIWQAITPSTQMIYGAPDPSRTITADPPPLSAGRNYTWVVLNNYGNHPAFSSMKVKLPPGEFTITGTSLNKPECIYPKNVTLSSVNNKKVFFKWKNLDPSANTYKLYIYVGSDFQQINAQLVVFQTEVTAKGKSGINETDSVEIDVASVLTKNKYVWRVFAVDSQGVGTAGDTVGFKYEVPTGTLQIYTKEQIVVGGGGKTDTVVNAVGLVELKLEVLDGSLEAPLLFYTDVNGYLERERPVGAYRITAVKNEFEELSRTVIIRVNEKTTETFYLRRPDATIFGKVVDSSGKGINLADIIGVSDRKDTVKAKTDALGNFVLNCYAADWNITVSKTGYQSAIPRKVSVSSGENYSFGTVVLQNNPFTLSGTVKNSSGQPLIGVRVRVYKNGVMVGEVPSTPQNGTFSFSLGSGTYSITAEKAGFTSYNNIFEITGSRTVDITLSPGAALIKGYIFGKKWIEERQVIAPITNARVIFTTGDSSGDSVVVFSDPTYGDFNVSLAGGKQYRMYCRAAGFAPKNIPVVFTAEPRETKTVSDTLQGLGMIKGIVVISSSGVAVKNADVSLIDAAANTIAVSGKSGADGVFELVNIPDGMFVFGAGREGLVLDSVGGKDTVIFSRGKADCQQVKIYLKPGDKIIKWKVADDMSLNATVKINTPIRKTVSVYDSITGAGAGKYIVSVITRSDSIIGLSQHSFTVADSETVHIDTVLLDVVQIIADTLTPNLGKVSLKLRSRSFLDSAAFYYKDAVAAAFRTIRINQKDTAYLFTFAPPADGSTMLCYFNAWRGSDVYGSDNETRAVYVATDKSVLRRIEIYPSSDRLLSFPSKYKAEFELRCYVGSSFQRYTEIDSAGISWSLTDAQGVTLGAVKGLKTTVTTGPSKTPNPVVLTAAIDTNKIHLAPGVAPEAKLFFIVTGSAVKTVEVTRIDAKNPHPITTASVDQAEFKAVGKDENDNTLDLFPAWSINPGDAGTISSEGVFRPKRNFAGTVRILASVGQVWGEYRLNEKSRPGLNVHFMITDRPTHDTVSNGKGCKVIFPPHVVNGADFGLLEISDMPLVNQLRRGLATVRTVDTLAFEIRQLQNVAMNLSHDSIILSIDLPKSKQNHLTTEKQRFSVAEWIEDSLKWKPLPNSRISSDGKTVSAALTHFSLYCLVYEPSDELILDIAPNPFSPYVIPHHNPFDNEDLMPQKNGTCIRVQADIEEARTEVRVRIYNIVGDLVWSMLIQNADNLPYYIWWDGRTSERDLISSGNDHTVAPKGKLMCRNGRYFAVVTAKIKGKEKSLMKHMVMLK